MRHELFPIDELPPGEIRAVKVDGVSIVVIRTPTGSVHALRDLCAHMGAKLSYGRVERAVRSDDVGNYSLSEDFILRCPWHGYEFDVITGRCLADPHHARVRTYKVIVEGDKIVLER